MKNKLQLPHDEVRMTSKEVVELINQFRKLEENKSELQHKDFMKSIRVELESLAKAGVEVEGNFSPYSYIAENGKENPCYLMTEEAVMQMLNKESAIVRFKTQQYIKALKEELMVHALPVPQTNLLNVSYNPYNNYNFKQYLNKIKPKDIPEELQNFIQAHESDKPEKRLAAYNVAKNALEELKYLVEKRWEKDMIQEELDILSKRIELQKTYINRSKLGQATRKNNKLEDTIRQLKLDSYDDYYMVDIHGFSINYSYCAVGNQIKCTKAYRDWKDNADKKMENLPTFEEMKLDPNKPKKVDMYFYLKDESFDVHNCGKSFLDALERHYKKEYPQFDDNLFADVRTRKYFSYSDSYENSYIVFGIKDLTDEEISGLTFDEENKGA